MDPVPFKLHPVRLPNVSCFLVYRPGAAMLVDCGNAGSEQKILSEMQGLGLEPGMLRLLVLTHAHFDHAGSAAQLKALTGCRIVIHRSEASRLQNGFSDLPPGTRWKARLLVGAGRILARRMGRFPAAEPDLLVDREYELVRYGFPGRIIHMPGHTVGSMVVLLEDGTLIGGDTFFGLEGKQHFPPFAEDLPALVESWKRTRELQIGTIYPAHGKRFTWNSFLREYDAALSRYARGPA
jgi:hydroxyacylglutathione hydrolase